MDSLNITENEDGTLTFNGDMAGTVLCSDELWATLEASDHVKIDARPAGDQGQPAVTYIGITTTTLWVSYTVKAHSENGYVLELGSYSEL